MIQPTLEETTHFVRKLFWMRPLSDSMAYLLSFTSAEGEAVEPCIERPPRTIGHRLSDRCPDRGR